MLDELGFPRAEPGKLSWFVDGPKFFSELDRQMAAAEESIKIQVFIFDNDDISVRYADKLKRRASDIAVHVLFDDLGSTLAQHTAPETLGPSGFVPPSNMSMYLRKNSKVRARRTLNPWLVCDHTKLMVFDQKFAMLGGMNMGREYYSEWHDLMVGVEGLIVKSLSRDFDMTWKKAGPWGDFALINKPPAIQQPAPAKGEIPLRILRTDPAAGRYEILIPHCSPFVARANVSGFSIHISRMTI
jgi:cardiolipin synthase